MFDQRPPADAPTRGSGLFRAVDFTLGAAKQTAQLVTRTRYLLVSVLLYFQSLALALGVLMSLSFREGIGAFLFTLIFGGLCVGGLFFGGTWAFRKAIRLNY